MFDREVLNDVMRTFTGQMQELFGEHLRRVILFGSYARGDADVGSDVDVMILVDLPREEIVAYRRRVSAFAGECLNDHAVLMSPIIENEAFFDAHVAVLPFYRNIRREGVQIVA